MVTEVSHQERERTTDFYNIIKIHPKCKISVKAPKNTICTVRIEGIVKDDVVTVDKIYFDVNEESQ